jgi:hypothetical protein
MLCFSHQRRNIYLAGFLSFLTSVGSLSAAVLNSPSQTAVNAAISAAMIKYAKSYNGGAYTNGAYFGGASVVLAVASYAGNTTADARLLAQIRTTITGGNEPCANGGYPAQHERHVTGMFAIAKQTSRIWNQLNVAEKTKIDLVMKATFIASAFTTADNNPYILAGTQQYSLDGDPNLDRNWNPNYREGMLGGVLVGMVYFGGPTAANAVLNNYNHASFLTELNANGLSNAYMTFNWKAANPTSNAPTGTMIQNGIKNYKSHGSSLTDYSDIYYDLVTDTYGRNVSPGLNDGAGVQGMGMIVSGAATLPNKGVMGMLTEFAASNNRSSLVYAYDGFRPHQTNQLVLIIGGYWQKGSAEANTAFSRLTIGNTDLWYKIDKSYHSCSSTGKSQGIQGITFANERGFTYLRSLWEDVLKPYHSAASSVDPDLDTDGDGTPDATEIRLGLNHTNGSSRFAITRVGQALRWPSATGLTFVVQRSTAMTGSWQTIATLSGTAGTASFTDPSPPAGKAFYRVGLNP